MALVLNLGLESLEETDGGGEVVDPPRSLDGGLKDRWRGDEIVGEGIVQVALLERVSKEQASGVKSRARCYPGVICMCARNIYKQYIERERRGGEGERHC